MGQLIRAHTTLHVITAPIAIAIFLGLAIHVVTWNPRRPISWIFTMLCLTVASIYVSDLFLISPPQVAFSPYHFLARWQWTAVILSSTFYLHLVFFYSPPAWQRFRFRVLLILYLFSTGLILTSLFTDLLVDGHLYHPIPHLIDAQQGLPFIIIHAGFFILTMVGSAISLLISYHSTHSPSFRQQAVYLLIIIGLVLVGGFIHWIAIVTETIHQVFHLLPDTLLILAALLYARAVVRYGSFAGRPLAQQDLFYSILAIISGLTAIYLTVTLDQWLMDHTPLPYYLVTGIFVLIVASGFPAISHSIRQGLDRWFFQTERQQQKLARYLVEALAEAPNSAQLQAELLDTLRTILGVDNGYIALTRSDLPPDKLVVQLVRGILPLQGGDLVCRPPLYRKEPQLVAALLPQPPTEPGWQDIALFCPLTIEESLAGILALGEKHNGTPFCLSDLLLCAELIKQLGSLERITRLRVQHSHYLQTVQLQEQTLRQLGEEATTRSSQVLASGENHAAPIEIRVLGPLQVFRQGQLIPEAAWGSEKAKGLLAYLLWKSPVSVTREELSEALWPGRALDETANVFHVTLHRLRRVFQVELEQDKDSGYILYDRGRYRFNLNVAHWLDATVFQSLVTNDNLATLQAAVNLYRGAYLEDMTWVLPIEVEAKRRQLEQLYADALRHLAAQVNEREALVYLEKLLAVEPTDETAQRALVLGYLARGRGDLARRQVGRWQQALAEYDLEASPETKLLWQMVEDKNGR